MPLNISGYVEPNTYIGERIVPAAVSVVTTPDVLGIVAHGSRVKRVVNEAVKRGQVLGEALTVGGGSPYTATLINRSDRRVSNTAVRRTLAGVVTTLPSTAISFQAAALTGNAAGPFDISTAKCVGIKLDSGQEITIQLSYNASPGAPTVSGTLVSVQYAFAGTAGNAATRTQVAAAINSALAAAATLGYGSAYGSVVTDVTTGIKITSPRSDAYSDVQVLAAFYNNAAATLGFTAPARATSVLVIADAYYDASATWQADYVATATAVDPLVQTASKIIRVGSFANVTSFKGTDDYTLNSGDLDWTPGVAATIVGSPATPFDVSTNNKLRLAFDGRGAVDVQVAGTYANSPPGWVAPSNAAAATAAEIVNNINAVMAHATGYGPSYKGVASVSSTHVALTSPTTSIASSVEVSAPASNNACTILLGLQTSQLTYTVLGTGAQPAAGTIYFITYEYARLTSDYNKPIRYFSEDAMIADLTPVAQANTLAVYAQIAFENNAPSVVCCQVNDTSTPGVPSVNEIKAAIDGMRTSSVVTDLLVADTRLNVQTYLMSHVESQSSPTQKHYRVGWFGMPVGTLTGDADTADTFVYRAVTTLQVAPDSPARGRFNLVGPTGVTRTIQNEDGTSTTLTMDSTAVACAVAAVHTSFTSPHLSLASKTITGFDSESFPTFEVGERGQLEGNGVLLVHNDGALTILDPVTTEMGGGRLPQFGYRSAISQKDNVTRQVERIVTKNLRGVVPSDLADFIFDIKITVAAVLTALIESGAIGPFRDKSGASRDINIATDIQAEQSASDPTKFFFRYWYFLRYPALRFMGEFSVDNPFFNV